MENIPKQEEKAPPEALKAPAKRKIIETLSAGGYLSPQARTAALRLIAPPRSWWFWANRLLLFLGAALILAGIVCFFAFNWAAMGRLFKFALIQAGLLACLIGSWKIGLDKITGKILLLAAALLVGVFLVVFGQVYQTGADAFELFIGWALLITGWVLISKFTALWVMWLTLIDTAAVLYWNQVLIPNHTGKHESLFLLLGVINTTALVLSYYGRQKNIQWLSSSWHYRLILSSILVFLGIPSLVFIVGSVQTLVWPFLFLVLFLAAAYYFYRYRTPDLVALTLCTFTVCILVLTAVGRFLFEQSSTSPVFLFFGFIVVGVFSGATYWLKNTAKKIKGEFRHD